MLNFEIAADHVCEDDGAGVVWTDPRPILFQEEPDDEPEICRALVFALPEGGFEIGYSTGLGFSRLVGHPFASRSEAQFTARTFAQGMLG